MSVNRSLRKYDLHRLEVSRSESGATQKDWKKEKEIRVSIVKMNDVTIAATQIYGQVDYAGITADKTVCKADKLISDREFNVVSVDISGRRTKLLLKAIEDGK